ncbi:ferric reductase-like transmembrane domain-containing protein [Tateyamaria pelophila]|uniref:ferric reductase-like transmembrane domain-containing protein n=1 Tax=Tateyamaria pelophila TaxID=328415 RepID=UPI001CBEDF67|nr:ferric reductase-like transmembrane domain-containing protein [Tateyamaria pelophila]
MDRQGHSAPRNALIWVALGAAAFVPLIAAALSPLLAWREPIYIASGFAGIIALVLLMMQPLLVAGYIPGLAALRGRRIHRVVGAVLVLSVLLHVGGLWITSPPDVVDVLLFRSPTPFSIWGVVAMWAVFAAALLATFRNRLKLPLPLWRVAHTALAVVIVTGAVVHTLLIEGTMEPISKVVLCVIVSLVSAKVFLSRRSWAAYFRN